MRLRISSSHAAKTPSSTFPPRLETSESAKASCSSTERERACCSNLATSGVICDIGTSSFKIIVAEGEESQDCGCSIEFEFGSAILFIDGQRLVPISKPRASGAFLALLGRDNRTASVVREAVPKVRNVKARHGSAGKRYPHTSESRRDAM